MKDPRPHDQRDATTVTGHPTGGTKGRGGLRGAIQMAKQAIWEKFLNDANGEDVWAATR